MNGHRGQCIKTIIVGVTLPISAIVIAFDPLTETRHTRMLSEIEARREAA